MSGECELCGEHCLDCQCNLCPAAKHIIQQNIQETQIRICIEMLQKVGLLDEFQKFVQENKPQNIFDAMHEFGSKYPDIFYKLVCPLTPV